jgi:hypothetical protein
LTTAEGVILFRFEAAGLGDVMQKRGSPNQFDIQIKSLTV